MDGRKRTVQIKFRVTEAERDLILEKMKLVPTRNMAAYLRKIAIDGYIIQTDHSDIKAMTAEIQKIGVNVNQIPCQTFGSDAVRCGDGRCPSGTELQTFHNRIRWCHHVLGNIRYLLSGKPRT